MCWIQVSIRDSSFWIGLFALWCATIYSMVVNGVHVSIDVFCFYFLFSFGSERKCWKLQYLDLWRFISSPISAIQAFPRSMRALRMQMQRRICVLPKFECDNRTVNDWKVLSNKTKNEFWSIKLNNWKIFWSMGWSEGFVAKARCEQHDEGKSS